MFRRKVNKCILMILFIFFKLSVFEEYFYVFISVFTYLYIVYVFEGRYMVSLMYSRVEEK